MNKNTIKHILLIFISSFILLQSCTKGENEGTIKYDIKFNEDERKKNEIIDLLPETMKYYFKNRSSVSEISYMGVFRTAYISNVKAKTNSVLFYFMPQKYSSSTKFGEKTLGFDPMPGIIITKTKETKNIKGLKAYKAHVSFEDPTQEEYDIWYTKEFKVKDPNWHTPYREIDGVLLDYRIKMKGISMHMTINSFDDAPIDTAKFSVPDSYKKVEPEIMDTIFDYHLNMF